MIAIIPARGNSKRLPRKNLLPFNGVPLVVRAIRCAKESGLFGEIIVSSEDREILFIAREAGARTNLRMPIFSDDGIQTAGVVFYVLGAWDFQPDSFCVLNPTSPLRTPELLKAIHEKFIRRNADCLMTMCKGQHDGTALFAKTLPFLRALDFWKMYRSEYWIESSESADINTKEDFERAEKIDRERIDRERSIQSSERL